MLLFGAAALHRGSICASHPSALGSIPSVPMIISHDVAEINRRHLECVKLEYVDQTI